MTKKNYYLLRHGIIKRKHNTIYFVYKNENNEIKNEILPVENIYAIYCYGKITIKSGALSYLFKKRIPVHYFNKFGFYIGSIWPRETLISGTLLVKQVEHYLDYEKRLYLAKKFVESSVKNIITNLNYYKNQGIELDEELKSIEYFLEKIRGVKSIEELRGLEGNCKEIYYLSWNKFLPEEFRFEKRSRMPPENKINALISFGNSLVYSTCLSEIYRTQLNPTISYLHEPSERRFSLSLDVAEIFKPIFSDRVIFRLINHEKIGDEHFFEELNYCALNDKGKRLFLRLYNEKLKTTIKHRKLNRKVSYERLVRLECYKLIKHLIGMKQYEPFVSKW